MNVKFKINKGCDKMFLNLRGINMQTEIMSLKFGGENDISLNTLSAALSETVKTLESIAKEVVAEDDFCKFKVKNIQRGSFEIVIQSIIDNVPVLMQVAPTVLEALGVIIELRKFLNGKEPQEITYADEGVVVKNQTGNTYVANTMIFNTYTSEPKIEESIAKTFETAEKDGDRTDIEYKITDINGVNKSINVEAKDFKKMAIKQDVQSFSNRMEEETNETIVRVMKPDLEGSTQWSVSLQDRKINVSMYDETFTKRIKTEKIPFYYGTKMKVLMRYRYLVGEDNMPITSSKTQYAIMKVLTIDNENSSEQQELSIN